MINKVEDFEDERIYIDKDFYSEDFENTEIERFEKEMSDDSDEEMEQFFGM